MSIKVNPFKNNIGASISCNLKSLESKTINQIKEALNNYGFVCFRDQNLDPGEYLKFAEKLCNTFCNNSFQLNLLFLYNR